MQIQEQRSSNQTTIQRDTKTQYEDVIRVLLYEVSLREEECVVTVISILKQLRSQPRWIVKQFRSIDRDIEFNTLAITFATALDSQAILIDRLR